MRMSALFGAIKFEFFEIYVVSTRTMMSGFERGRTFAEKGVNFSRYFAYVLYVRPFILLIYLLVGGY